MPVWRQFSLGMADNRTGNTVHLRKDYSSSILKQEERMVSVSSYNSLQKKKKKSWKM